MAESYETPGSSLGKITRWWQGAKAAGQTPQPWEVKNNYLEQMGVLGDYQQGGFAAANAARRKRDIESVNMATFDRSANPWGSPQPDPGTVPTESSGGSPVSSPVGGLGQVDVPGTGPQSPLGPSGQVIQPGTPTWDDLMSHQPVPEPTPPPGGWTSSPPSSIPDTPAPAGYPTAPPASYAAYVQGLPSHITPLPQWEWEALQNGPIAAASG